jgi:Site-specific recombinase XerD
MPQGKQAKTLTDAQVKAAMAFLETTRYPARYRVLFLLSIKAGLRAKEISSVTWAMVTDAEGTIGDIIALENNASKGKSGRTIPINKELKASLVKLQEELVPEPDDYIIASERGGRMAANSVVMWFNRLFNNLGFDGCSSHSGRRTFITNAARKVSLVGASLRDVQQLAGHSSLQTTQRYVEGDTEAKRKLVNLI